MTSSINIRANWQWRLRQIAGYLLVVIVMLILPVIVSDYIQSMIVKILIFSIFAMSLNLLWGYTGLTSLGHAAYFGIAGYTVGILNVVLGIHNFWLTALAGIVIAAIAAAVFAIPALRMANTPVKAYFLLVTLALGELLASIAEKWRAVTGGDNGLAGIPMPQLGFGFTLNGESFYYLVFIIFAICLFLIYRITKSPFGEALQGIRENELRMRALGYHTWLYKYFAFLIGGAFAGVGGVLFSHFAGIMAPMHVGIMTSTLVLLMVIIGSSSTIYGPVLGAAVVLILEHVSSIYAPDRWPLILGGVFVVSVMFLRGGISIHLLGLWKKFTQRSGFQRSSE
jgi:branched-chain amino acid transport system permease protein